MKDKNYKVKECDQCGKGGASQYEEGLFCSHYCWSICPKEEVRGYSPSLTNSLTGMPK